MVAIAEDAKEMFQKNQQNLPLPGQIGQLLNSIAHASTPKAGLNVDPQSTETNIPFMPIATNVPSAPTKPITRKNKMQIKKAINILNNIRQQMRACQDEFQLDFHENNPERLQDLVQLDTNLMLIIIKIMKDNDFENRDLNSKD